MSETATPTPIDTLPISEEEWLELTGELDAASETAQAFGPMWSGRHDPRVSRHELGTLDIIRLANPGGREDLFKVRLQNLSQSGIGFLHGESLVIGTPCTVGLRHRNGRFVLHSGRVVRCRGLKKRGMKVFDVGLKFAKPIEVRELVPGDSD